METISMAGRARKTGPREKNGRPQRTYGPDRGTEELQRRRAWLAQKGDPVLTVTPLGVLLANSIIDNAVYNAASRYAWLHAILFGRISYAAVKFDDVQRGRGGYTPDEEWLAARRAELERADECFDSRHAYDDVLNLVIFERMPPWLLPGIRTMRDVRESNRLVKALEGLAVALGTKQRKAA
jgi:hypothetical protein